MKIGILGAGRVARVFARYALVEGHGVVLSNSRGPESLADMVAMLGTGAAAGTVAEAAAAEVVLLAVPWTKVETVLAGCPAWDGRILIDATNPFAATEPELVLADLGGRGASEIVASLAPGARLVKALNSIFMSDFELGPRIGGFRRVLFVSGDDADARMQVSALLTRFGFATVDLGGLATGGRMQQAGAPLAGPAFLLPE
jgi:predicted dinucleotide-binding enzyme